MRESRFVRETKETKVEIFLNLDSKGEIEIDTGIPFFDHMLKSFAKHSNLSLKLKAKGDLEVDEHHTVEDVAIALGKAINMALGDKRGIKRFGYSIVPMDDAVAICGIDISGRGYLNLEGVVLDSGIKGENFKHFFDSLCRNSGINMYLSVKGENSHHIMEAAFKAFAVAFLEARKIVGEDIPSVKGVI